MFIDSATRAIEDTEWTTGVPFTWFSFNPTIDKYAQAW